jgi:hypothetical protein
MGSVVVVARKGHEIVDWEDFEEGSNLSPVAPDGRVLEPWCNQDELKLALNGGSKEEDMGENRSRYANSIGGMFSGADLFTSPLTPPAQPLYHPPAMLRLEFRFQTW